MITGSERLKGKWVLITGATAGIGRATAELMARAGANLILTGRRRSLLEELEAKLEGEHGIRVAIYDFDIRSREACQLCISALKVPVDLLINNAGLARGVDPVDEAEFDDWETMIDTNIKGLLYLSRLISPKMKARGEGHIINIGSLAGHEAYAGGVVYCATKHAVKAITEATKKDLHGTGVRVSMVSPGLVETDFSEVRFKGDEQKAARVYEGYQALTAEDIAEIILFTASRPAHVNLMDTLVLPTAQSSSTMVDRDG